MLSWEIDNAGQAKILFDFYKHLIHFRKQRKAMQERTRESLNILSADNGIVSFERSGEGDHIIIVLNFNKKTVAWTAPKGSKLKKIIDSASSQWGGPRDDAGQAPADSIELFPESISVFET